MKTQASNNLNEAKYCMIMLVILTIIFLPHMTTDCFTCWAVMTFDTSGTRGTLRMTQTSWTDPNTSVNAVKCTPFLPSDQPGFFKLLNPGKIPGGKSAAPPPLSPRFTVKTKEPYWQLMYLILGRSYPWSATFFRSNLCSGFLKKGNLFFTKTTANANCACKNLKHF